MERVRYPDVSRTWIDRRGFMGLAAAAALTSGCLGEDLPEPVSLDDDKACDQCGMIIEDHPGPKAQTYYDDHVPEGRSEDDPAWFCSLVCMYNYYFDGRDGGLTPLVHYVTDYSALDYEVVDEGGSLYVTAHLAAEGFVDGDRTTLVVDSDAQGAMGPSLVPFTSSEDAEEFQAEYGGDLVDFDDVDQELLGAL